MPLRHPDGGAVNEDQQEAQVVSLAKRAHSFIRALDKASLPAWMQHTHASWGSATTHQSTSTQQARSAVVSPSSTRRMGLRLPRTPQEWQALARLLLALGVYGAAFGLAQYGGARLAIAISPKVGVATPLYLQGAVLVAALLVTVPRRWWLYLLATLLVLPVDLWLLRYPFATAEVIIPLIYVVLVSIAILVASLLRWWRILPLHFATLSEVSRFVACVAVSVVPATIFITVARSVALTWNFWSSLETGFLGYLLGIVVFTPAIVLWLTDGFRDLSSTMSRRRLEAVLVSLTTVTVSLLVFVTRLPQADVAHALIYVVVPVLIWAAVRFGPLGLASTLALSTAIAVLGAVNNRGPFVGPIATNNVLALQLYLLCVAVPLYFLAALVRERAVARVDAEHRAAQLQATFEGIADGVAVYDAAGHVVRTNPAARRLLGLDAAPANYDQLPPADRAVLFEARDDHGRPLPPQEWPLLRVLSGQAPPGGVGRAVRLRMLDGREVDVYASAAPLRDAAGHVMGAVTVLHDLTEQRRLEEARVSEQTLREVNERLDTFVAIAAHDLRQPVTATKLRLQVAQRQVLQAAAKVPATRGAAAAQQTLPFIQVANALEMAQRDLDRVWRLMQQLLDVTRARQGTLVLDRQLCDLTALVHAAVDEQRLLAPDRTITLTLDLPDGCEQPRPLIVDADADRLNQVLTNYLANAVRYSPGNQPIEVTMRVVEQAQPENAGGRVAQVARVEVHDHGAGIAPEEQATIWDRFQRARSAREAKGGLGLGLYIARTIIELHGGHVGVESVVGEGSTFWFTLPLSQALA